MATAGSFRCLLDHFPFFLLLLHDELLNGLGAQFSAVTHDETRATATGLGVLFSHLLPRAALPFFLEPLRSLEDGEAHGTVRSVEFPVDDQISLWFVINREIEAIFIAIVIC